MGVRSLNFNWKHIFSNDNKSHDVIFFFHVIFAFIFYSNFFLFNRPLIASTDVIHLNFPLLLTAQYNFMNGNLGLWNPYILGGVSTFSSSNAPIFSPNNWPLFLFPMKYFFLAGTFFSFLSMWLLGVFSYLIFLEEFKNKKWAFFASLIYQLSGYTIWSTMVFDVLPMYLFTTVAIYLIWSHQKRKQYINYIFLTLTLLANMLASNIAYTSYSMMVIGVFFLYRYFSQYSYSLYSRHFISITLAFLTSVVIHLFRLIPVWVEVHDSNRQFSFNPDLRDTSFLSQRLFNPEIFGVAYQNSTSVFNDLGAQFNGMHVQWAMPSFFGVLPALLVLWAIVSSQKGKINFWTFFVIIALSLITFMEPLDTLFRLMNPVYHTLSMQIFLPFGFAMLAGYAAKNLEENSGTFQMSQKLWMMLIFIIILIILYQVMVGTIHYRNMIPSIRIAILISLLLIVLGVVIFRKWPEVGFWCTLGICAFALCGLLYILFLNKLSEPTFTSHLKNLSMTLTILLIIFVFLLLCIFKRPGTLRTVTLVSACSLIVFLAIALFPWTDTAQVVLSKDRSFLLSILGFVRFLLIALIFLTVLKMYHLKTFKAEWLFPLFMVILIADLVPAGKIHSHIVMNPFYKYSNPYPPLSEFKGINNAPMQLDLTNYRVNFPNTMLNIPLYNDLFGSKNEVMSSIYSVYKIRSYGGHYNVVSSRYSEFIKELMPIADGEIGYGVYQRIQDERFLDLMGVRYHYNTLMSQVNVRPNALSRVMFFDHFEVIEDKSKALQRLKDKNLEPLKTLVINRSPGFNPAYPPTPARKLEVIQYDDPDQVEVRFDSENPGIVAFNDSYHEGWNVYVNGVKQNVMSGNFNFMAVAVPSGENKVIFRFEPTYFRIGLKAGGLGLVFFIITSLVLFLARNYIDSDFKSTIPSESQNHQ